MDLKSNPINEILYVSFNQDQTCFVCGTSAGFRVYNVDPFRLTHRQDFDKNCGLGVVAMLFQTNILAFSGDAQNSHFQPNKVILWDDRHGKLAAELRFRSVVRAIRMRRDLLVVALDRKVFVYGFPNLTLVDSIETVSNLRGMVALSADVGRAVLVCPAMQRGHVLALAYKQPSGDTNEPADKESMSVINAFESAPVASMSTDFTGTLLAVASEKGTVVRVFDVATGTKLHEVRRGVDRAEIHSLTFSQAGDWLAVSSDKGTVHLFAVGKNGAASTDNVRPANAKSNLRQLTRILPSYFSSEWSLAQFRVPDYRCIAAFGAAPNTLVVVCANGSYYKAQFHPEKGGVMHLVDCVQFHDVSTADAVHELVAPSSSSGEDVSGGFKAVTTVVEETASN